MATMLVGCGPSEPLRIEVHSAQAWAHRADLDERARAVAAAAAGWWGASLSDLDGWTLAVIDPPLEAPDAGGLTLFGRARIEVSTAFGPCVEAAPIPHEIGHAVLFVTTGDPDSHHLDSRWRFVRPAGAAFCGGQ